MAELLASLFNTFYVQQAGSKIHVTHWVLRGYRYCEVKNRGVYAQKKC